MAGRDVVFLTGVCHPNSFNRAQGAYRLASIIRNAGYTVSVVDGVGSLKASQIVDMLDIVLSSKTKLFCISTTFFSNFSTSVHTDSLVTTNPVPYNMDEWMNIINLVKRKTNAKIIVGGHKTNEFERDKDIHSYIDHYVYGYADQTILKLLSESPTVILHSDKIPSDDFYNYETRYDVLDSFLPGESFTVEMQRGCMFKCSFCAYPMNGKQKSSYIKQAKVIVDELVYCYNQFGSTNFILNSDTFNDDIYYLEAFNDELAKTNIKFNFGINARLDLFYNDLPLIEVCKSIGVRSVLFGLESTNPFSLKEVGKGLPFDKVVTALYKCKDIWKDSVRMTGSYIIGLPYDTEENILKVGEFFSLDDCPLHSIEFDPLYVQNPKLDLNPWKSEYSVNAEKHGFKFKDSLLEWTNENTPYKTYNDSVIRAEQMISSLPASKKGTIKSAAYMHLPNNIDSKQSANEKFELIFKHNTYKELNDYYSSLGITTKIAKTQTANRYYNLFLNNNRDI